VVSFTARPLYSRERAPSLYALDRRLSGHQNLSGRREEEKYLPYRESNSDCNWNPAIAGLAELIRTSLIMNMTSRFVTPLGYLNFATFLKPIVSIKMCF
jgi:hypothetical protein